MARAWASSHTTLKAINTIGLCICCAKLLYKFGL